MSRNLALAFCLSVAVQLAAQVSPQVPTPPPPATAPVPPPSANLQHQIERDERVLHDYGNLARYHDENLKLAPPAAGEDRVLFMGDSITDDWGDRIGAFFPGKPYVNRGISGQVTSQMLLRFRQDVINLQPKLV